MSDDAPGHMSELDVVKRRLVRAFEEGTDPDLPALFRELPQHREEILDFWVIVNVSDPEKDLDAGELATHPLTEAEEATIRDICLSASLGPGWLQASADEGDRTLAEVGLEMRRIRSTPYRYEGTANEHFQRAAIYAWLAYRCANATNGTVSRMAVQKLAYLLEQGFGVGLFGRHRKHRLGPYDPTARYRDAEPIAFKNGYLVPIGKYDLGLGPDIERALGAADRYLRDSSVADAFVRSLVHLNLDRWALETLATVHAVAVDLPAEVASTESILTALAEDKKWRAKLSRPNFTPSKIAEALHRLSLLHLLD